MQTSWQHLAYIWYDGLLLSCHSPHNPLSFFHPQFSLYNSRKSFMQSVPYRHILGNLRYFVSCTWSDLSYSIRFLSRFMENHGPRRWEAWQCIFRYLKYSRAGVGSSSMDGCGFGGEGHITIHIWICFHFCLWYHYMENQETSYRGIIFHQSKIYCSYSGG